MIFRIGRGFAEVQILKKSETGPIPWSFWYIPVNVPIQRTAHLFSVIPPNDTKENMFGHQNVSSPAAGIKPDILAPEAGMCANH